MPSIVRPERARDVRRLPHRAGAFGRSDHVPVVRHRTLDRGPERIDAARWELQRGRADPAGTPLPRLGAVSLKQLEDTRPVLGSEITRDDSIDVLLRNPGNRL